MSRMLADLGNSRLKWARVLDGELTDVVALPTDDPSAWAEAWNPSMTQAHWSIASVNPPVAQRLGEFLTDRGVMPPRWLLSAADVSVPHRLEHPNRTGVDRALAVREALSLYPNTPGIVVSCGTAITVERIGIGHVWDGGAIAAGLGLSAKALHLQTAQLPLVFPDGAPRAWGQSTEPAMAAGLFWGMIGAINELIRRQSEGLEPTPWLVLTGGDCKLVRPWLTWPGTIHLADHLVLSGLMRLTSNDTSAR